MQKKIANLFKEAQTPEDKSRLLTELVESGFKGEDFGNALVGADLSQIKLEGKGPFQELNLSGINLERVNLNDAVLRYVNLKGANLSNALINGFDVVLEESNLNGIDAHNFQMSNIYCVRCSFSQANLKGANLENSEFHQVQFHKSNLSEAQLKNTRYTHSSFDYAIMQNTNLTSGAEILGTSIQNSVLTGSDLQNTVIKGSRFHNVELAGANLLGAYYVENSTLPNTDFSECSNLDKSLINSSETSKITNINHFIGNQKIVRIRYKHPYSIPLSNEQIKELISLPSPARHKNNEYTDVVSFKVRNIKHV